MCLSIEKKIEVKIKFSIKGKAIIRPTINRIMRINEQSLGVLPNAKKYENNISC